jgi:hypothetical protein
MGDWDYINEHMGGHDEDGLPNFMNDPNFNLDYDPNEKDEQGFFVHSEGDWTQEVNKELEGSMNTSYPDGFYFPLGVEQVDPNNHYAVAAEYKHVRYDKDGNMFRLKVFDTFDEAKKYATNNPGVTISRLDDDSGFVIRD